MQLLDNLCKNVCFAKDLVLAAIDFDFAAAVLAEDDFISNGY